MKTKMSFPFKILIIVALVAGVCVASYFDILNVRTSLDTIRKADDIKTVEPIVGGDRDKHGCIPSAGYTWCEVKQYCLREWEEPCVEGESPLKKIDTSCESVGGQMIPNSNVCEVKNVNEEKCDSMGGVYNPAAANCNYEYSACTDGFIEVCSLEL